MRCFLPAALLALIPLAPIASAQDAHRPRFPSTASSNQNTYETDPAADPARPTVTNPAHIPPPGYLQFEQGVLQASSTLGGPDSQFSLVQLTKLSLNHRIMPFVATQPYAHSRTAGISSDDPGDLAAGVQVVFVDAGEGHSRVPSLALSYSQRVRSGTSPNLDVGEASRSALFLASGNLPFGIHYDTNMLFNEQPGTGYSPRTGAAHDINRTQFGQTASFTHSLTQKLALTGELWRFSQPYEHGSVIGNLYTLGYTVRKTLVLDAGFSRGLTGLSTHWETFAGFTYLLPHRLTFRPSGS